MRAVRVHELTGPNALRVDEIAAPEVRAGQVLIDVRACGVNFPDILLTRGQYQFKPAPPFSPGGEVAGIVRAVGDGVTAALPFSEAAEALHRLERRQVKGKLVLVP